MTTDPFYLPVIGAFVLASISAWGEEPSASMSSYPDADFPVETSTEHSYQKSVFGGPSSVRAELYEDGYAGSLKRWEDFKGRIDERHGLEFAAEYSLLFQAYSDKGSGAGDAASGIFRLYGAWDLLGRESGNTGSLVFRVDHRHAYGDFDPQTGGVAAGSVLPTGSIYSDREWGLVNLQWNQTLLGGRAGFIVGMTPADDYFHAYALASVFTSFQNLAFSTGGVIAIPDTGFGIAGGGFLNDNWYLMGGIHDANGDAHSPDIKSFFDEFETFKNIELGWTTSPEERYLKNIHVGVWQVDDRGHAGVEDDWGITFNWNWYCEGANLMPFIRGGWSEGRATLLDTQVSAGLGRKCRESDLFGFGVSWGSPSDGDLDDQWTSELFYRFQYSNIAITPSVQFIVDPSGNADEDTMFVGGFRGRIVF